MHTYLGCYPCFARQALGAAQQAGADYETRQDVVMQVLALLQHQPPGARPAEIADAIHRLVRVRTGCADPYRDARAAGARAALDLLPELRERVAVADDPLDAALRLVAAGSACEIAASGGRAHLLETVEQAMSGPLAVDHVAELRAAMADAGGVLYLAGGAAGTACDRVLIERLGVPVTYAVHSDPVTGHATREDALAAGIDECAEVVETGSDAPGTLLHTCSPAFRRSFGAAGLVLAIGQAGYESLSDAGPRVFNLLLVTCPVIGRDLGVEVGDVVVRRAPGPARRRAAHHGKQRTRRPEPVAGR